MPEQGSARLGHGRVPAAAGLLTCASLVACSVSVASVVQRNAPGPRNKVDQYLSAIKAHDLASAYADLCPGESKPHFESRVNQTHSKAGSLLSWSITTSNRLSNGDAVVTYTASTANGGDHRSVTLLSQNHAWCISSIE